MSENTAYGSATRGKSALSFDIDADQFIFQGKTAKDMAGCCSLILEVCEFDEYVADFEFK